MELRNVYDLLLYFIVLPLSAISFLLHPITSDVRIFLGVEYIADKFYPFPFGWDLAWEIKPIGNRIINWALYKLASLFVSINNQIMFGVTVKVFALIAVVVVSVYFADVVKTRYTFALTFLALVAIGNISVLQAEWWATIVGLLAIALLLQDNNYYHVLAGVLLVAIGLFKGITIVMFIPILCAVLLLKPSVRLYLSDIFFGVCVSMVTFLWLDITIWPHVIPDMLMSAPVAYVGAVPMSTLLWYAATGIPFSLAQMPVIAAGLVATVWYSITHYRKISTIGTMAVMWLVPFATVVIQPELMIYHYYLLTIPALAAILMMEDEK